MTLEDGKQPNVEITALQGKVSASLGMESS